MQTGNPTKANYANLYNGEGRMQTGNPAKANYANLYNGEGRMQTGNPHQSKLRQPLQRGRANTDDLLSFPRDTKNGGG